MNFIMGYLLGRMSTNNYTSVSSHKIDTDVEYSCDWWLQNTELQISKPKMCIMLQQEVKNGTVQKETNSEGLVIFVPINKKSKKELLEKWSDKV